MYKIQHNSQILKQNNQFFLIFFSFALIPSVMYNFFQKALVEKVICSVIKIFSFAKILAVHWATSVNIKQFKNKIKKL